MKLRQLIVAAAAVVFSYVSWGADAWRMNLTVTGYTGSETLTGFPVLVRLPADFPYADCGEGGGTIRFADAGENLLSHEIDTWNPSGESLIWVKLPSLASSDTTFTMFFGAENPLADTTVDFRQTWSRYAAVVHGGTTITGNIYNDVLFDGSTPEKTGDVHDSSPNNVSVKMFRSGITKTTANGYLGSCFDRSGFSADGNALGLGVGNPRLEGRLDDINKFSISGWYKADAKKTYTLAGDGLSWADNAYFWLTEGGNCLSFAVDGIHDYTSGKWALEKDDWRHFEVTVIDEKHILQYRDGVAASESPLVLGNSIPSTTTYNDSHMSFGALRAVDSSSNNKSSWMGLMDELRVFNGTASADWVKAEFETASKADFLTAGDIEETGYGDKPVFSDFSISGASFVGAKVVFNLKWAGTDKETANAVVKYGLAEDALTETLAIGAVAVGEQEAVLPRLTPSATYYFQLTVDNDLTDPVVSKIVTFTTPAAEALALSGASATPDMTSANVRVTLATVGEDADSAEVSVIWGASAGALANTNVLVAAAAAGQVCNGTIEGLSNGTMYYYAFTAKNNLGQIVTTATKSFTTLAPEQLTLANAKVMPSVVSAEASVKLDKVGEGAARAEVSVIWGTSAGALANTNVLAGAAAAGQVCNGTIDGLTLGTTYYYAFTAKNNLGQSVVTATKSFTTLQNLINSVEDVGTSSDPNAYLIDRKDGTYALVFTNVQTTAFTFKRQFFITEALVVGGGGSGGGNCGAGGGAGGFVYLDNLETIVEEGSAISLTVGAGGGKPAGKQQRGVNGADSLLTLDGSTYTAVGGGGGGTWGDWEEPCPGAAGGSGGGACVGGYIGGASTQSSTTGYGLGNAGGAGGGGDLGGGGGGAGSSGKAATSERCGDGGWGVECDITGEALFYAAGGGGTSRGKPAGKGGSGIGGDGAPAGASVAAPYGKGCGFPGKDGTGSGGGGGESDGAGWGGAGGSGIVILRISTERVVKVSAELRGKPGQDGFSLDLTASSDGGDGTGVVSLRGGWSLDAKSIPDNEIAANVPVRTAYPLDVTGLEPGSTYHYSFYSVNSRGETSQVATGTVVLRNSAPVPYPTLDVSAAVVGQAIEVDWGSYTGPKVEGGVRWQLSSGTKKTSWVEVAKGDSYVPTPSDYGHWIKCVVVTNSSAPVALEKAFYFSRLPVFYMTTDDGQTPTYKKESHDGKVFVQGNGEWSDIYDGTMTIKVRGNSTAQDTTDKYSWKLKLGEKAEMFGIPKSKHWVLLANELERTFMRNKLAYDFANEIGSQGMRSLWVECVLNGEHKGIYQLCEHIRVAKDRVNVFDWEGAGEDAADAIAAANGFSEADTAALEEQMASDFAWVTSGKVTFESAEYDVAATWKGYATLQIDGGCLIEMSTEEDETSRFEIASGALSYLSVMVNSPEFLRTNEAMFDACKARIQNYFDACTSVDGYNANGAHWSQLADTDSMAAFFLVLEMFGNDDGAEKSRYLHWDAGKPIVFGPVWDFDWGVGSELVSGVATGWKAQGAGQSFYRDWTDDPWFCTRMRTIYWSKAREPFARIIAEGGEIDDYYEYLYEAAVANEIPFDEQVTRLRNYLTDRLVWLDQQFADVPTLMASLKNSQSTHPYTADTTNLAISFENAPTNVIARGTALQLSATAANASATTVGVYVNGLKVGEPVAVASGRVACEIPAAALTEAPGCDNCVSLVARDSSGNVVSRNYALVKTFNENPLGDGYLFVLEGDYAGVQTLTPTGAECRVILNGARVPDGIVLVGSAKFEFKPAEGTENEVGSITGPTASFKLEGKGTLSLEGPDTLVSVSNLHVKSGTFAVKSTGVTAAKTPVVNVLGYAKQSGGTIDLDLADAGQQTYGIYIANKNPKGTETVYGEFADGFFHATVGGVKSAAVYGNKGSADVTFKGGETVTATLVGAEARLLNIAGKLKLNGGDFTVTGETTATDAHVFKCDREISVKAGVYRVTAAGTGSEIFSTSKNKDGDPSTITISGGTFELVANDDCFNADDNITVSGGLIYAVSTANDVFDSNGDMTLAGGTILAFATGPDHEAFDVEPMATGDNGIPHVLTVNGGTLFGTGGAGSAWPTSVQTAEGVNVYQATGLAASSYSGKFLSIVGGQAGAMVTSAVKLPTFPGATCAIFATCPGMATGAQPTLSATAPSEGNRDFHELYVWGEQQTNQGSLRFHTIYGSTNEGSDAAGTFGDEGEYIILTNASDQAVSLAGVKVSTAKSKKGVVDTPSCSITLTEGTVPAYGTVRLDQADWTGKGWKKITNGDIVLSLTDAYGIIIQSGMASFNLYPECDGGGSALTAKRFDVETPLEATTADWGPSGASPDVTEVSPGHPAVVEAESAAAAIAAVEFKVEVPTDEAGAPVVDEAAYKAYFALVADPVAGETGKFTVSAELDKALVVPVIASLEAAEGRAVVSSSKAGLYYTLLRGETLDAIDEVRACKLATGDTVSFEDTGDAPDAAFYRVMVTFDPQGQN